MEKAKTIGFLSLISILFAFFEGSAGEPSGLRRVRAAVTSISGSMAPAWAAHESGIFAKHGLQVEVIATPSGLQGMNTLIAREVDFVHIAGGTTAGAAVGGADVRSSPPTLQPCCSIWPFALKSKSRSSCVARTLA